MKMYTNSEQTAKLIGLGLEKPKNAQYVQRAKARNLHSPFIEFGEPEFEGSYSIGELLSFLPKSIKVNDLYFTLCIHSSNDYWIVEYADIAFGPQARLYKEELIDALFAEIVVLKEEGVI